MKSITGGGIGQVRIDQEAWLNDEWPTLIDGIAVATRMTEAERLRFAASRTARLIAAIPYVAGCSDARRTAYAHLATYVLASRDGDTRKEFDHRPADDRDLFARLRTIADFDGGNQAVIRYGMALLALNALNGYNQDREKDIASGEYNPLVSGAWDYSKLCQELQEVLDTVPSSPLSKMVGDIGTLSFWV